MKKMIFATAISSMLWFAVAAQTPVPPTRSATTSPGPASSVSEGGTGAEGKVAYIISEQFRESIGELKAKLDAFNVEFEPKRKELQTLDEELKSLKNKIQTQSSTVSPQVRNQWAEEAAERERILKRKAEDYEAQGQKRLAELSQPVSDKIQKSLDGYCQRNGIVLVLEGTVATQAGILFWATSAIDITEDFMKEYNKANPVATSPAPAAKKD